MACEPNAPKGSFYVKISKAECPRSARIVLAREIATTFADKNRLLEEVVECLRGGLVADEREMFRVRLSIDEGVQNAFSHGNGEDPRKRIRLEVFEDEDRWGVIVRDEGEGFAHEAVSDPRTPEGRWREHGRGLMIMWEFMDEVSYFDGGRTLRLVKRKTGKRSLSTA